MKNKYNSRILYLKKIIYCVFFSFCLNTAVAAQGVNYGLEFKSHEVDKENRTGLDLTPEKSFNFSKGFTISFDVLFERKSTQIFGYILRIIGNNNQNIDFILASEYGFYPNIRATSSETESLLNYVFEKFGNTYDEWIHINLTVETEKNLLLISIGNENYSFDMQNAKDFKNVNLVFGKNDYLSSRIRDVPPMIIKDILIKDLKEKPLYHWPLSKHTDEGAYDELKNHFAYCSNPSWIMNNRASWEKLSTFTTKSNPQICYNEKENVIAIVDAHYFNNYNTNTGILEKDSFILGVPHGNLINQLVYHPIENKYFSYSFENKASYYDSHNKSWNNSLTDFDQNHWHHNRYIYPGDSCLYVFFGYGHHNYSDGIIRYDFKKGAFEAVNFSGNKIYPRYLSGLGKIDDDRVLIFGGYGSTSGNQTLFPKNYYDCYIVNLKEKEIKKLWELNIADNNFVVSNSLIVDSINNCFYSLCFPQQEFSTYLQLYRFSMEKPHCDILADSIPFSFHDIQSYCDLYLNNRTNKLYAITYSPLVANSASSVSIYSLAYPPLSKADLFQNNVKKQYRKLTALAGMIFLLCLLGGFFIFAKKIKMKNNKSIDIIQETEDFEPVVGIKPVNIRDEKQSIFLFGGFQVMDKNGQDITGDFTPLLKQLFIIILLNTLKDGKGISSLKLRETLWFDKSEESAKNNRGVYLSKLRQIFEQIGLIQIIKNQNSYWIVEFGNDIYCDYYEALILIERLKDKNNRTVKDIKRLFSIISYGEMLPNLQIDWVDPFKANFLNEILDIFADILKQSESDITPQEYVDLANTILIHDSLNEEALRLKCSSLIKIGKIGLAKKIYNSFVKEYNLLFGKNFKYSFNQIISNFS